MLRASYKTDFLRTLILRDCQHECLVSLLSQKYMYKIKIIINVHFLLKQCNIHNYNKKILYFQSLNNTNISFNKNFILFYVSEILM